MELEDRIRDIIRELQEIQHELENPSDTRLLASPRLPDALAREFKAEVDRLRVFLWAYMEAHAASSDRDRETRIQSLRVERATEMLMAVRTQMGKAGLGDEAHARTLLSEVHTLAALTPGFGRKRTG